eukprot:213968-Prorocentrum_minimum.AAC.3
MGRDTTVSDHRQPAADSRASGVPWLMVSTRYGTAPASAMAVYTTKQKKKTTNPISKEFRGWGPIRAGIGGGDERGDGGGDKSGNRVREQQRRRRFDLVERRK